MRPFIPWFLLTATAVTAAEASGGSWHSSLLSVHQSEVALMPEGTPSNYEDFRPIRPTIVAWGEDALPTLDGGQPAAASLARKFADYRRLGATAIATNVWMLTATEHFLRVHPDLANAACIDLWGQRIVPAWLADADDHGTKPWWGCTNQPQYEAHLIARLRAGLAAGATMVHLDDHSGTFACATGAGGCFCPRCLDGFRRWLKTNASTAELEAAGVHSTDGFDYATFLKARGYADRDAFIHETWAGRVPLWPLFLAFQRDAARAFIDRLRDEARTMLGHDVPIGVNAYDLHPQQLFDADIVDYFANEVEHYGVEDTIPPLVYRLGEAFGRPVFATGTGEDWIAYRRANAVNRVRGWVAEAYAFGQYFMYSWNKWGYSKETGTVWTQVPTSVYQPITDFIRDHATLFDAMENRATVGILYDNHSVQKDPVPLRAISQALLDAGIPYRLVVNGDDNLRRAITPVDLAALRTLIVPTNARSVSASSDPIRAFQANGGRLVVSSGSVAEVEAPDRVRCTAGVRVWALPRFRASTSATKGAPTRVVHLLNRDYDAAHDTFAAHRNLEVQFDGAGQPAASTVTYYTPSAAPQRLTVHRTGDGESSVTVPELDMWGVIAIE